MKMGKRIFPALLLSLCLICLLSVAASAADEQNIPAIRDEVAVWLQKQVPVPDVGSIGGEWLVIGLARSGAEAGDAYFARYYDNLCQYLRSCGGILHQRKYTEYSRVVLALTAIGRSPSDVAGYDLLTPLADYDSVVWQGLAGPVWALIALDSGNYAMPKAPGGKLQASREMYIQYILSAQLADGGWAISGSSADPDMTAMALIALSSYTGQDQVKAAVAKGVDCLSRLQDSNGGYSSWGTANAESTAQVILALCELGISMDDSRFFKGGNGLINGLLSYYNAGSGGAEGFCHTLSDSEGSDQMASEQAFCALVAICRQQRGDYSFYKMAASGSKTDDMAFTDIAGHDYEMQINALAKGGFINGMGDGTFQPDKKLSRGEFAAMIVRALGLQGKIISVFEDVPDAAWFAPYIGAAYDYGMITGRSASIFDPYGTISDSEALLILDRVAVTMGIRQQLTAKWYRSAVTVTRGETAAHLYDLLQDAARL